MKFAMTWGRGKPTDTSWHAGTSPLTNPIEGSKNEKGQVASIRGEDCGVLWRSETQTGATTATWAPEGKIEKGELQSYETTGPENRKLSD